MNLNIDAIKTITYDAIVVGSGVSGGYAAKELTEKGLGLITGAGEDPGAVQAAKPSESWRKAEGRAAREKQTLFRGGFPEEGARVHQQDPDA